MKSTLILPLLALSVRVFAIPPACLLQAVNTQDQPGDLSAVCGDAAGDVQQAIYSMCGDNNSVAQSAFIATCSGAGSSVAAYTPSSTQSSSASETSSGTFVYTTAVYNSECDCTTTIVTSATGAADSSNTGFTTATATTTGSGASATNASGADTSASASATGNVAADVKGLGSFAAAAMAIAGVVAVL